MRKDWEYKKLGEVAFYPNDKISVDKIGANHYVGVENLLKDKAGILFSDQLPNAATATCFKYNDILLGNIRPYLKKIWLSNTEGGASGDVIVIRTSSDNILPNYLFKLLSSDKFFNYFNLYTKGAKMPRGDKNAIAKFIVPTPPKPTQLAIVAELDKINELIQLKKQQLKDYDQLAQSIFYEMFGDPVENEKGWEKSELKNNVKEMFLGPFGSSLKIDSYVPKEMSYCMVYEQKHAIKGNIHLDNHYITEEKYNSLKRFTVLPGDFIMSCRGTIGKLYQLPPNAPLGIIHPSLMKIRIRDEKYNATFFKFLLIPIIANEQTNGNCVQMAITAKALGNKKLPLPPLPLQQQFAARIEAIERQKQQVSETIKDLETLLASRMQYWFD